MTKPKAPQPLNIPPSIDPETRKILTNFRQVLYKHSDMIGSGDGDDTPVKKLDLKGLVRTYAGLNETLPAPKQVRFELDRREAFPGGARMVFDGESFAYKGHSHIEVWRADFDQRFEQRVYAGRSDNGVFNDTTGKPKTKYRYFARNVNKQGVYGDWSSQAGTVIETGVTRVEDIDGLDSYVGDQVVPTLLAAVDAKKNWVGTNVNDWGAYYVPSDAATYPLGLQLKLDEVANTFSVRFISFLAGAGAQSIKFDIEVVGATLTGITNVSAEAGEIPTDKGADIDFATDAGNQFGPNGVVIRDGWGITADAADEVTFSLSALDPTVILRLRVSSIESDGDYFLSLGDMMADRNAFLPIQYWFTASDATSYDVLRMENGELINQALDDAAAAQATADGKIQSFYQDEPPTGQGESEGDIWYDTNDGKHQYIYESGAWVDAQDSDIATALDNAATAQATADGKVTTFYAFTEPTPEAVGDMWFNKTDSRLYRWDGADWNLVSSIGDPFGTQNLIGSDAGPEHDMNSPYVYSGFGTGVNGMPIDTLGLSIGDVFSFAAEVRSTVADQTSQYIRATFYKADGTQVGSSVNGTLISNEATYTLSVKENAIVPADAVYMDLRGTYSSGGSGTLKIRRARLNKGPVVAEFTEPPFRANRETADDVTESDARKWAAESGADVTLAHVGVGENLVVNGDCSLGDITGWDTLGYSFDGVVETTNRYAGKYAFYRTGQNNMARGRMFQVDPNDWYAVRGVVRRTAAPASNCYVGLVPYDKNGTIISRFNVAHVIDTATTLAAEALSGATTVEITDATNWTATSAYIAFNVQDDFSDKPNFEVYKINDITGTTLTLNSPLSQTYAAGTKVRNHRSGGSYIYIAASFQPVDTDWTVFTGVAKGELAAADATSTLPDTDWNQHFWPGTVSVQPMFLLNYGTSGVDGTSEVALSQVFKVPKGDAIRYSDGTILDDLEPAEASAERTTGAGTSVLVDDDSLGQEAHWGGVDGIPDTLAGHNITDGQQDLGPSTDTGQVLHRDLSGTPYWADKYGTEMNAGFVAPLGGDLALTGSWATLGETAIISNPGKEVTVLAQGGAAGFVSGGAVADGSDLFAIRMQISFDGGSTFTTSGQIGRARVHSNEVNDMEAASPCYHARTGTPTGDIHIRIQGTQSSGTNTVSVKADTVGFLHLVQPRSSFATTAATLTATVPSTRSGSCSKAADVGDSCTASATVECTPNGGAGGYTYAWSKDSGSDSITSGATAKTCTVSGTHTTADPAAEFTTTVKCQVTDADTTTADSNNCVVTLSYEKTYNPIVVSAPDKTVGCTHNVGQSCVATGQLSREVSGGDGNYSDSWTKQSGAGSITSGATTATPTVSNTASNTEVTGVYRCTITDGRSSTGFDDCTVTFKHLQVS